MILILKLGTGEESVKLTEQQNGLLLKLAPTNAKITYGEYITILAQVTYTINCRPVGVFGGQDLQDEIQPLTPNQLEGVISIPSHLTMMRMLIFPRELLMSRI